MIETLTTALVMSARPHVIAFAVGLFFARRMRNDMPEPSRFAQLGFGIMLVATVAFNVWFAYATHLMQERGSEAKATMLLNAASLIGSVFHAVAVSCLLKAIYAGRAEASDISQENSEPCTVEVVGHGSIALPSPRFDHARSEFPA
ncbi:hypothetical protein [Paludisphaera borealis]|uniref:Transmembrane protein n=1 Tax=Paludisphaera borealis TaxID=1387353 RepID=A0A1U7CIA4_9BACT|nr:hypothetical protein [Paludisphaera borealis]APW58637.1 hypothetical protein BSF38_00035 [Paludisphaera borealis]